MTEPTGRTRVLQMRLVVEAADARAVTAVLVEAGAELIAKPAVTPWASLNSRLAAPAGLQITVYEELGSHGS